MHPYHSFTLHHFVHQLDKYADNVLQSEFGISYSRFLCLVAIDSSDSPTQHDIAGKMLVDDAVVSRMLTPLAADNLVTITADPSHGRRKITKLTARGSKLVHQASLRLEKDYLYLADAACIDPAELTTSITKMHKILDYKPSHG